VLAGVVDAAELALRRIGGFVSHWRLAGSGEAALAGVVDDAYVPNIEPAEEDASSILMAHEDER
jgi:hypothetical protein